MKRILGVVGSPRKGGNTHILVCEILESARQAGAETNLLCLGDLRIQECDGCHVCWKGNSCPKRDDMLGIYDQITRSDVILFGTPVYWYGPTALMKGFIDRFVYFNCEENRPKIRNKQAALVIPFEEQHRKTAEPVVNFFQLSFAYLEMHLNHRIIVPGVTRKGQVLDDLPLMQRMRELGHSLATEN